MENRVTDVPGWAADSYKSRASFLISFYHEVQMHPHLEQSMYFLTDELPLA